MLGKDVYVAWRHGGLAQAIAVARELRQEGQNAELALMPQTHTEAVATQKAKGYWDTYFNPETARYAYRIVAYKLLFENPKKYGVMVSPTELYQPYDYKEVEVTTSIPDLMKFSQDHHISYKTLKEWNPWLRSTKLTVAPGKKYIILIPKQ